jgi:hypothetical protein
LHGRIERHHRFLLRLHLQQVDALDAAIAEIDREADAGLACFRDAVKQLSTIPRPNGRIGDCPLIARFFR